ncbi:hypothetical protein Tco_0201423 [Tanacetum coccineum]
MPHQPVHGPPVGLKPKSTFVYRLVSSKKAAKANGNPKVQMTDKATTPTLNLFETLSTLVDEKEGWGNQTPSNNATLVVARINDLEREMVDGKLMLVDEHRKPPEMKVNKSTSIPSAFNVASKKVVDEIASIVRGTKGRGGFLKDDLDWFDGYKAQIYDLHEQMHAFCDQFDIRLNNHVRK